jgi:DNA mismatch repair ATPase MutS
MDGLLFDHILKPGRARTRNAIALLPLCGASPAMVQDASECAAALEARGSTRAAL